MQHTTRVVGSDVALVIAKEVGRHVDVAHRAALFQDDFGTTQSALLRHFSVVVEQLNNLVLVGAERERRVPIQVAKAVIVAKRQFYTPVAHVTQLDILLIISSCRYVAQEGLLARVALVERQVER